MTMPLALAFDLGGTQLRAAVVDGQGQVKRRAAIATAVAGGPSAVVADMLRLANEVIGDDRRMIVAAGVCAPGPLDSDSGTIIDIPTLPGWTNFPLKRVLAQELALPVVLENDGIAAAFGEWKHGAGRGLSHLVYVTVSTGIGGGVVADGRLLRGRRGMAGHVGHMMIARDGPKCSCGGTGCFEALASGTAFSAAARATGYADAKAVVKAARHGDPRAAGVVAEEADILGYGLASLHYLFSPERIVIGGGVSNALDIMAPRIRAQIERLVMPPFRDVEIVAAELGDNAGLVGVASLAASQDHPQLTIGS